MTPYWTWFFSVLSVYKPQVSGIPGPDVIIGYAQNYRLADVRAFVQSIEKNVGVPFILVGSFSEGDRCAIEEKGGQVVPASATTGWRPLPAFERFLEVVCILRGLPEHVTRVVCVDTRDLIFQRNPFRDQFGADIVLYSEGKSPKLAKTATGKWLAQALGKDALSPIAEELMANCGVILADRRALERFLFIESILGGTVKRGLLRLQKMAVDQALANYVAHNQLAGTTLVKPNLGRVANLCDVGDTGISICDGVVCSPESGEPFDIVHMFDRNRRTRAWAHEKFGWKDAKGRSKSRLMDAVKRLKSSTIKRLPEVRF